MKTHTSVADGHGKAHAMAKADTELKALDEALQRHFESAQEPSDDGFCLRVMSALPARVQTGQRRWIQLAMHAQWTATGLAAFVAATLLSSGGPRLDTAHNLAALALIGLLTFWSIPTRWSRA